MTQPAPETIEREASKLYVTDAELIRRLGVPEKRGRLVLVEWSRDPAFPKPDKFLGGRRYWPAVQAFLDQRNRVSMERPNPRPALPQRFGTRGTR